jgi:autoinducer 2-degrading protein
MYTTIVHVYVKADHINAFIEATRLNHEASVQEPGNRRFDVLQEENNPGKFILYEAYASKQGADLHKQTTHYLTWRNTVAEWMEKPRQGITHIGLFPKQ